MGPRKKHKKRSSSSSSHKKAKKRKLDSKRKKKKSRKYSSSESSTDSSSSTSSSSSSSSTDSSDEERRRKLKKLKKLKKKQQNKEDCKPAEPVVDKKKISKSAEIPPEILEKSKAMAPMTKEEWEKRQSVVRRVYDETTGRYRLIKGDGEVIEEIVSKDRHRAINQQATHGDGNYFQAQMMNHLNRNNRP